MKILSNDVVSRDDLSKIDEKQSMQIKQLRVWLAASFAVNLIISLGIFVSLRT